MLFSAEDYDGATRAHELGERLRDERHWRAHNRRAVGGRGHRGGGGDSWTPLSLPGLLHYWRVESPTYTTIEGDNDIISIVDRKGTDNLVQATEANKPDYVTSATLKSRPASRHPGGSTTFLTATLGASIAQPFSAWVVCSRSVADAFNAPIGSTANRFFLRFESTTSVGIYAGGAAATQAFASAINTRYAMLGVFAGVASKIRINGASVYAGATNIGAFAMTELNLGVETPGLGDFHGDITEVIVCSGDLTANAYHLAKLEAWGTSRY